MSTTRLRVTLVDVQPKVERLVDVPADITLGALHNVLQIVVGWTNSHLRAFRTDSETYATLDDDSEDYELDEWQMPLAEMPSQFFYDYDYDFGDGWTHEVEVVGGGGERPLCVDGQGACPPEDCGGPYGYAHLRETLGNPPAPFDHTRVAYGRIT